MPNKTLAEINHLAQAIATALNHVDAQVLEQIHALIHHETGIVASDLIPPPNTPQTNIAPTQLTQVTK